MRNLSEMKKAVGISLVTFTLSALVNVGAAWTSNYHKYHSKVINQGGEIIMTKTEGPFTYLRLIYEKGVVTEVSKNNSLTNRPILMVKLNDLGEALEMIQNSFFTGEQKLRASYSERYNIENLQEINKTVRKYIATFFPEKKMDNPYQKL